MLDSLSGRLFLNNHNERLETKMNKIYKESYQAPEAKTFVLPQSLHLLVGFSVDGDLQDPDFDDEWGKPGKRGTNDL